jgi:hypothetical protein
MMDVWIDCGKANDVARVSATFIAYRRAYSTLIAEGVFL